MAKLIQAILVAAMITLALAMNKIVDEKAVELETQLIKLKYELNQLKWIEKELERESKSLKQELATCESLAW